MAATTHKAHCLDGLVDVWCPKGQNESAGSTGPSFYLSDLPGINLKNAVQSADHEEVTGASLMRKAISFAQKMSVRDFLQLFRARQLFMEQIGSELIGYITDDILTPDNTLIGAEYTLYDTRDRYVYGYVEYIEFRAQTAVADKEIFCQIDDGEVQTLNHNFAQGYNKIQLDARFENNFRVWYDSTGLTLFDSGTYYSDSCEKRYGCYDWCNKCVSVRGLSSSDILTPWTTTNNLNGIRAAVSCKGDPLELVCQYRNEIAAALLYRAGGYMMESAITSTRANPYVRNTKEEAQQMYARWMGGTDPITGFEKKGEYWRLIQQAVEIAVKNVKHSNSKVFKPTSVIMGSTVTPFRPHRSSRRGRHGIRNIYKRNAI